MEKPAVWGGVRPTAQWRKIAHAADEMRYPSRRHVSPVHRIARSQTSASVACTRCGCGLTVRDAPDGTAPARIQSSFKPSAKDTAAPASFIFRAVNRAIRSPMLLLGTVWRLSKFAAQVFGRPSSLVNTTSVGMLRIVEVIGAMVTEFSTSIAESRVTISTGRLLSGALKVYQQISPRFTMRPNPAH